jgi:copper chaperone CopZ
METLLQTATENTSKIFTSILLEKNVRRRGLSKHMRTAKSAIHAKAGEGPCGLENAKMAVSQIEGVFDVEANHVLDLIKVEYDQDRVTLAQIRRIVKKACTQYRHATYRIN